MTRLIISCIIGVCASLVSATALAQEQHLTGCPIYRDTDFGKKSGCWLIDDPVTGKRYDISKAPYKPDWNHKVLVEGVVSDAQDNACGGIVMDPVRVSVLEDRCTRHMLPAETYPGRKFERVPRVTPPMSVERPTPSPPFAPTTFTLLFNLNQDFIVYQLDDYMVDKTISWIRATSPSSIEIVGYAATVPHPVSDDGSKAQMSEPAALAQQRAEKTAFILERLGVAPEVIKVRWQTDNSAAPDAELADGLVEPSRRRVDIHVTP